ncbi:hypothetical protein K5D34_04390 [Pseudomonas cichorii]|nr:hypothetical protein [Pseudomonas cichorii]MBX8508932.1 hypothetical protein [Pseudomonas cichorii]MBX8524495.1 hypothetical protein [Pseudomonas cichorii]MBX8554322.1 hypothetical protein [Pseudomonas cichorii]
MGMIIEFIAIPPSGDMEVEVEDSGVLVSSLSVNSLAVAELFSSIAPTELAPLIGDGADAHRLVRLQLARQSVLMAQVQPWVSSQSELLLNAFDALEIAVDEAQWRQQDLLIRAS